MKKYIIVFLLILTLLSFRHDKRRFGFGFIGGDAGGLSFYAPLVSDLELDVGEGSATFTRSTTGTVFDYAGNVATCAINEARFEGARRIHENRWSDQDAENAIEFDGSDDDILVSDHATVQNIFDGGGSISCWINPKTDGELNVGNIFNKNNVIFARVRDQANGLLNIEFGQNFTGNNGRWRLDTPVQIPINQSSHFTIVYDNSSASNSPIIYWEGSANSVGSGLTEITAPTGTRISDTGDLNLGNSPAGNTTFDGFIDNLKMWNIELTAAEALQEYNATTKDSNVVQSANLQAWWKLDDTDSSITDYSDNTNTGTFRDNTTPTSPTNVDGVYNDGVTLTDLDGVLVEKQRENLFLISDVPDTQVIDLAATGDYTLSVEGSGDIAVAAGTATGTGFGTATEGTDITFNITGAGTVTCTLTGSLELAQVELGSFDTSFIITAGASVTRTKDTLSYPSSENINESQGSFILDFNSLGFDTGDTPTLLCISDGTANNQILIQLTDESTVNFKVTTGGVDQVDISDANVLSGINHSVGFVYSSTYCNIYLDGTAGTPDTSATLPTGLTTISIGSDNAGANQFNGTVKEVNGYSEKLTDSEMEILTQWSPWETWGS